MLLKIKLFIAVNGLGAGSGKVEAGPFDPVLTVAMYHTHPMDDGSGAFEYFSYDDIRIAKKYKLNSYLGTPRGNVYMYNPHLGLKTKISTEVNRCP